MGPLFSKKKTKKPEPKKVAVSERDSQMLELKMTRDSLAKRRDQVYFIKNELLLYYLFLHLSSMNSLVTNIKKQESFIKRITKKKQFPALKGESLMNK